MLLGRIDEQIAKAVQYGEDMARDGCVASRQAAAQPASHEGGA